MRFHFALFHQNKDNLHRSELAFKKHTQLNHDKIETRMKQTSYLIKPASSLCNYACAYCFYDDVSDHRKVKSMGLMSHETQLALIQKTLTENVDHVTYAFQGGEPTLAGLDFFKSFVENVKQYKQPKQTIVYALQTNGSLIDEAWCDFLKTNNFLVGLSLDGFKSNHDLMRLTQHNQVTFEKTMQTASLLRTHEIDFNLLTVLTNDLAKAPEKLYTFYKTNGFDYVQLIPCLAPLDQKEDVFALSPQNFASFYKVFYALWLEDYKKGQLMSVALFDNLIPMFRGIAPMQCGMLGFCSYQSVIESDGGGYPCDFYVLDELCLGNIAIDCLADLRSNRRLSNFIHEKKRMSPLCPTCRFKNICNGNCKRLNPAYFNDAYCAYQDFLEEASASMIEIAKTL